MCNPSQFALNETNKNSKPLSEGLYGWCDSVTSEARLRWGAC